MSTRCCYTDLNAIKYETNKIKFHNLIQCSSDKYTTIQQVILLIILESTTLIDMCSGQWSTFDKNISMSKKYPVMTESKRTTD